MEMRLTTYDGVSFDLPVLTEWELCYTGSVPCDSFTATCLYEESMAEYLPKCYRFGAFEDGALRLYGVVDEYTVERSDRGALLTVSGRGLAALLLDNESTARLYQQATMEEILRDHVYPYGIHCATRRPLSGPYQVPAGVSQWKALEGFTQSMGGFSPWFRPSGELVAVPMEGEFRTLDGQSPILSLTRREKRFGVVSEVLVVDKKAGSSHSVPNGDFLRKKGSCRRVLYKPSTTSWDAMRYSGEYQIAESEKDAVEVEVTLPVPFAAWPGDRIGLEVTDGAFRGIYRVREAVTACGREGILCRLTLWAEE